MDTANQAQDVTVNGQMFHVYCGPTARCNHKRLHKHPAESPTYGLHEEINIEHARTTFRKIVKLSINNYFVGLVHKHHIINEI